MTNLQKQTCKVTEGMSELQTLRWHGQEVAVMAPCAHLLAEPGSVRSFTCCTGGSLAECKPFFSFLPFSSAISRAS